MRSLLLLSLFALTGLGVFAQKLDKAKDLLSKNKLAEAKTEIDNLIASDKNKNPAEALYTKSKIYLAISQNESMKATVPDARETAFEALKQYAEMESTGKDEAKRFLSLTLDNRQPLVDLYQGYSKDAASFFNAGNYNDALTNFKKSYEVFEFMAAKEWTNNLKLDTTTALYAGVSAEKANKPDEAAVYYGKIAENKATGEGFAEIYKWLTDYHYRKGNKEEASKFMALGKEVYPKESFWNEFELEALREDGNKEKLFQKYEQILTDSPQNFIQRFNYGVELYQAGYNPDSTQRPANSKELIAKSVTQLEEALKLQPDYASAHLLLGQIHYNMGVDINNVNKEIRPKQGAKLTAAESKKKEELRKEMNAHYDQAIPHFVKVDELLGAQGKLKSDDKARLKEAYDLLISIYEQRQDRDNANKYTEKFNGVEKIH